MFSGNLKELNYRITRPLNSDVLKRCSFCVVAALHFTQNKQRFKTPVSGDVEAVGKLEKHGIYEENIVFIG